MTSLLRKLKYILLIVIITGVIGCSSMPATNSGFLSEHHSSASLKEESIRVIWQTSDDYNLKDNEKALLIDLLKLELDKSIASANLDLSSVQLSIAITRVETVSPALNWLLTIALLGPLDRGGAAVEFNAIKINTSQSIAQLQFSQWVPLSEFTARYKRLKPAKLALTSAARNFVKVLKTKLDNNQ